MHMDIFLCKLLICHTGKFRMSLYILVCDLSRLLHHITEVSCHRKDTLALAHRTLDKKNLSTHRCPGKACHHSRGFVTLLLVVRIGRKSEILTQMRSLQTLRI